MKTIPLTQGKVALIDEADFEAVNRFKWCAAKDRQGFYAVRTVRKPDGSRTTQRLHQFLMPGSSRIDHRDGDGLNNQRHNLRPATRQQNAQSFRHKQLNATSKFRGVSWYPRYSKWQAQIQVSGKSIPLGYFVFELDAAKTYNEAALKWFGEFAHLNAA